HALRRCRPGSRRPGDARARRVRGAPRHGLDHRRAVPGNGGRDRGGAGAWRGRGRDGGRRALRLRPRPASRGDLLRPRHQQDGARRRFREGRGERHARRAAPGRSHRAGLERMVMKAPVPDLIAFLTKAQWTTPVFWVLVVASIVVTARAWMRAPGQRDPRNIAIWALRFATGLMWWQGTLWKIPPNYAGLVYWMKQMVDHGTIPLQSRLVRDVVVPNIAVFGPAVYLVELAIAVSMLLGLFTRLGALLGVLMS